MEDRKMDLEKLKEAVAEKKLSIDVDKLFEESMKFMEDKGVEEGDRKKCATRRVFNRLKMQLSSNAETFEGVIAGSAGVFRWNEENHKKFTKLWNEGDDDGKRQLVEEKKVDANGIPIDKWGKELDTDNYYRELFVKVKTEDGLTPYLLRMFREKAELPVEFFKPVRFRAKKGKEREDGRLPVLNSVKVTGLELIQDKEVDFPDLVEKHLAKHEKKIEDINMEDVEKRSLVVVRDCSIISVAKSNTGRNNWMLVTDGEKDISCWLPKDLDLPSEEAMGIILVGKVGQGKDMEGNEVPNLSVLSLWVPKIWRLDVKPQKIEEEQSTKEEKGTKVEGW